MRGLIESWMPKLSRLLLRDSYVTQDALALLGRSDVFERLEEIDFSIGDADSLRGVEVRRLEDCFCQRQACRLKILRLRASGLTSRRSKTLDRKARKTLERMHKTEIIIH